MAVIITYQGKEIHKSIRTEEFTLFTNNLIMKSDIIIYADANSSIEVVYDNTSIVVPPEDPSTLRNRTYNLLCKDKLMISNLSISVSIRGTISYNNVEICTEGTSVTLPENIRDRKIMLVLIGGGTGGQAGHKGSSGRIPPITNIGGETVYSLTTVTDFAVYDPASQSKLFDASKLYKSATLDKKTGNIIYSTPYSSTYKIIQLSELYGICTKGYVYYYQSNGQYHKFRLVSGFVHVDKVYVTGTQGSGSSYAKYSSRTSGGAGGLGGLGGSGGKVYRKELTIQNNTIHFNIGSGGAKGASNGAYGKSGENTTAQVDGITYSSKNGESLTEGFFDSINSKYYALSGNSGIDGADGGGYTGYYQSEVGSNLDTFNGGNVGNNLSVTGATIHIVKGGGSGGGAAVGANGNNGGNASSDKAGNGGKGANAIAAGSIAVGNFGYGGNGGNGGGGGGNAGGYDTVSGSTTQASAGAGGTGSAGSAGTSGAVLIYYNLN